MNFLDKFIKRVEAKIFLGEVIEDYGIVSEYKTAGAFLKTSIKTSILLCKRRGNLQIVMRTSSFACMAAGVKYDYIPASCASRLKAIMENVEIRDAKVKQSF